MQLFVVLRILLNSVEKLLNITEPSLFFGHLENIFTR